MTQPYMSGNMKIPEEQISMLISYGISLPSSHELIKPVYNKDVSNIENSFMSSMKMFTGWCYHIILWSKRVVLTDHPMCWFPMWSHTSKPPTGKTNAVWIMTRWWIIYVLSTLGGHLSSCFASSIQVYRPRHFVDIKIFQTVYLKITCSKLIPVLL